MKKVFSILFALLLVITIVPMDAFMIDVSAATSGYYTYSVSNGEVTITDCNTLISGDVEIPTTLGGYPVTRIGNYAFSYCDGLTSVTIPDGINNIGSYAFSYCYGLTSVTIPNSVTSMGQEAFYCCNSLEIAIVGKCVKNIESSTFYGCKNLCCVIIGDGVESIGNYAFSNCDSLTSITIPNSIKSVGDAAFSGCDKLENVYYRGSDKEKSNIIIIGNNYYFIKATWYYNSCIGTSEHTHDDACDVDCNICHKTRTITHDYEWVIDVQESCGYAGEKHEECTICHATRNDNTFIDATNQHEYDDGCDDECNICFTIRNNAHTYDNACDAECNVCHVTRETTHTYNGDYICDECGHNSVDISKIFPDTSNNAWYSDAVAYAYSNGILKGYANGKFGTSDGIQRQDFLAMLARYDGADLSLYEDMHGEFKDVGRNAYYESSANWGKANNIVSGYNDGRFGVGDKITREQIVTFLWRYAQYKGLDVSVSDTSKQAIKNQYKDFGKVSVFSQDAVLWALDRGVIGGKDPQTIAPQGNAQRCEVAQIMYNIFKKNIF